MIVWTFHSSHSAFNSPAAQFETQPLWLQVVMTGVLALAGER